MFKQIRTIAFYTLLEALRNRLSWLMIAIAFIAIALSGFLKDMALTESAQLQVALLASFLRFSAAFLIATFVITSMVREMNDKGLELLLSLSLPRSAYLFGKLLGYCSLAVIPAFVFGGLTIFFSPLQQSILWSLSLICELWIIVAFAILCVLSMNQILTALSATMGFYLLARSITALLLIANDPLASTSISQIWMQKVMNGIASVLPHLDQFTRTEWLVYQSGNWTMLNMIIVQSVISMSLLGAAAMFDLYRKNI
jgi:ABC-type transport system involved in multi-copper enzyme maturation permease subunit